MILIRKNVYKRVCLFENVFNVFESCLECVCVFVFENSKDCLQIDQVTRSISTYSKVFLVHFYSFDIVDLPLIW